MQCEVWYWRFQIKKSRQSSTRDFINCHKLILARKQITGRKDSSIQIQHIDRLTDELIELFLCSFYQVH